MNEKESIISRIRKVLALAQNNHSKEKGQNAMLMAQKLIEEIKELESQIEEKKKILRNL